MMKKNNINANSFADLLKSAKSTSYAPLSKSVCAAMLAGAMVLGGGVFVSPAPAYADGYVSPDGNNIYYGYKSDADYSKDRIKIEVHYYSNMKDAEDDTIANQDPLGKFVHVKYTANLNSSNNSFDKWAFRPMWWYGVPAGLTDVHDINYSRFEKYTGDGNPVPSRPGLHREDENVTKHYANSKDWKGISNFYITDPSKLTSMNGLKTLLGIDGNNNNGYDNKGNTAGNWSDYYDATKGMQGMFVDWESAGQRYYQMTYVAELTDKAWKERNEHPLRFAAGVYRFAGNWHIATGQTHHAPKIADSLKVKYPDRTPVAKVNQLTDEEQGKVKDAIYNANKDATPHFSDLLDGNAGITVGADGTATLKFKDNTTLTMPGKLLVMEQKRDRDLYPPTYPAPVPAVVPESPNKDEKDAIIKAIKDANKSNKNFTDHVELDGADTFTFDDANHQLKIKYKDNSELTIPYSSLVYQGAKIADWAPYSVPDVITVDNLTNISDAEVTAIKKAFDDANSGLDVYTNAKTKDSAGYLTIDKRTGNATIKWADGSTTEIASWQFLKEKEKTTPAPEPSTPVAEEKTFTVDAPASQTQVNFNPFSMAESDLTTNSAQIDPIKNVLKAKKGKDSKNPNTQVNIDSVEYSVENGIGYITFKANGYKDAKYPMGMFFKQKPGMQTPKETEHTSGIYKYKVTPIEYTGNDPTPQQQIQALKDFVKSNYGTDISNDASAAGGTYVLKRTDIPVQGTSGLQFYDKNSSDGAGVATIGLSTTSTDGSLTIQGYEKGDSNIKTLFTVPASELYVKKNASGVDHTVSDLKDLAKKIRDAKKASGVTDIDFKRAGIDDASDNTINGMNEKQLRELIRKLTDATKAEYIYTASPIEIDRDPNASDFAATDDEVQAAVKAFLKANYTGEGIDSYSITGNSGNFNNLTLTPKTGTKNLELKSASNPAGIDSFSMNFDDNKSIDFKNGDTVLFNVPADKLYKKKTAPAPTPSSDELNELRKQAKEIIDRNPNLTPEQKKKFKGDIDKAKDKPAILKILNEAKNQGETNKNSTDPNLKKQINDNKGGGEEKDKHELQAAKDAAKKAIEALTHLSEQEKKEFEKQLDGDGVKTPADVQKIVDAAKLADELKGAKDEAQKAKFVFLDHGTAKDEDAALNSVLDSKSEEDSTLKTLAEKLKATPASASEIRTALEAAKRANDVNEQNAKNAGIAKLEAKKAELDAAYKALTPDQQASAKTSYDAAIKAIDDAKNTVNGATKPSEIKTAIESVDTKIEAANNDIKTNTPKRDTTGNTNDPDATTFQSEKDKAKKEIDNIPDLTPAEKQKYKEQIDQSTHKGDPEAIVNQAKKHKKIEAALKAIDNFEHLNNAQKEAFKRIIEDTDASDHKNADGTTSDDIDDALANAANTDNAMARLGELEKKANDFKNEQGGKYSKLDSTKPDEKKQKDDFDNYLKDATTLTTPDKGDAKGADEVNTLYDDLLKAMRAIDPQAKSAGLKTDALKNEIDSDKKLKPDTKTTPATKGDSVYTTASQDKKTAFDTALSEAEQALTKAGSADISDATKEAAEQKKVDEALDKLVKARLALDGVDTTKLQTEIDKDSTVNTLDRYTYSTKEKKDAFDQALQKAKDLIKNLTTPIAAGASAPKYGEITLDTKENKQRALDAALKKLQEAEAALKGKKPVEPTPTPTPTPSVDKSHLQQGIDNGSDVHNSDDYNNAPSDKKQAYDHALDHANEVNKDPNATQDQVNQAAEDLKKAENDLKPTPSPLPSPVPGGAGFGVNDNAPTTVDKGELNVQIDSAEADSQPGNAGAGNAGNTNAGAGANSGNAANANNNAANGANSAAVNAAVENSPAVKQADAQVAKAQAALDSALAEAKKVAADPNATQAQVDAAAQKLSAARKALASAKAHAAKVRASVRAQVLKSGVSQLSKTGSNVSVIGLLATVAAAGAAFFVSKRRGTSRHSNN